MATKATNKKENNKSIETIKKTTKDLNNFVLGTSEVIIDEALEKTTEWQNVADKAIKAGFESITFDRGGYIYHGRVKSLAEGAREGGLKF